MRNTNPQSVNKFLEQSIKDNWWLPAISNYQGETISYSQLAERIVVLQAAFKKCSLRPGDKVAICGRNQTNWAVSYLAALTFGAVPVPLLHEFTSENIHNLINHSDSKVFFVDKAIWDTLDAAQMPNLAAVLSLGDFSILNTRYRAIPAIRQSVIDEFHKDYPLGLRRDDLDFFEDTPEKLALISYTSGTSGFSKGVMIPYRALWSNIKFSLEESGIKMGQGSQMVAMLPAAHMYGMLFEFLHSIACGAHVQYLTRVPSPNVVMEALRSIQPNAIVTVPLVIEKIYKNKLKAVADKTRFYMTLPITGWFVRRAIRKRLVKAFGGRFQEVILGGAAFNPEIEKFFHKIGFPYTIGYGMTEAAPIITYSYWNQTKVGSCGKPVKGCNIRIDSPDPARIPGEVQISGENVFMGYYNNDVATLAAFTDDGWFKTGDMGVMRKGYLYLRGRCKCMLLSSNGQNIYPEELEAVINTFPYVVDSLVVERDGALVALVYPDYRQGDIDGIMREELCSMMTSRLEEINRKIPAYAKIRKIEVLSKDFERTPKQSIKRYLYH